MRVGKMPPRSVRVPVASSLARMIDLSVGNACKIIPSPLRSEEQTLHEVTLSLSRLSFPTG